MGIDYRPNILDDVIDGGLYVLRGPRRVGKSVALKRFAADRLARPGTQPLDVIYLALDTFEAKDFRRALRLGRELTAAAGPGPRTWLVDEVTAVTGWADILKSDRDNSPLAFDTVVVTGSSASGLDEARRSLGAGRTGAATNPFRLMLPMTFGEFCRVTGRGIPPITAIGPGLLMSEAARTSAEMLAPFLDDLDLAWQAYTECGRFPRAVAEYHRSGHVSEPFLHDLVNWLAPDVTPNEGPQSVLALIDAVSTRSSSPLNVSSTAERIGLTRERLRSRLERLRASFASVTCPQVDGEGATVPGSQSKLYLLDPLLMRLPSLVDPGFHEPAAGAVSEAAMAVAIARSIDSLHPGRLLDGRAVGYGRTGSGHEVDFAPLPVRVGALTAMSEPIESRWVSSGWRSGALTIENRYGHGIIATKDILDLGHPAWALPAPTVALLLG